ncbi:MAG TPA: acyl-CoA desaturase [Rhodothermales bacterium]|nr:acyl-CoA desaturase [Rhodothermales bacterium]
MSTTKIRFNNKDVIAFVPEVRRRVTHYFETTGRSQKADWRMVVKTIILLGGTVTCYLLILSGWFTLWQMLALAVLLGVGMAGIGFSVSHDALHGAYSSNKRVNQWLGYTFDALGANGYMWQITHNVIHHTYTNIHGVDEDLTVSPLLRLSPDAPHAWYHRFQHIYGILAYSLATLNWLFVKDYQQFLKKDIGPYTNKTHPRKEWIILFAGKSFVCITTIIVPLVVLDITWWQFLIGFLAMHLTAGMILGVIFQLAHVVEGPAYPAPDEQGVMEHAWLIHEMHTTANFAGENRLLSWYIGGLNYQIEHHLFPQVCSVHYPAISSIVREVAQQHGVPYHYNPTLRAALRSHQQMLKQLGREEGVPVAA